MEDFPDRREAIPKDEAPTYYLANFYRKLQENKENWVERGGSRPLPTPVWIRQWLLNKLRKKSLNRFGSVELFVLYFFEDDFQKSLNIWY